MPCNSPNKIFYNGTKENGKKAVIFTSRKTDFIRLRSNGEYECWTGDPKRFDLGSGDHILTESDLVPCNQCIGCRIDYSRQWAARVMLEKKKYPDNECWFLTVTYNDDSLPKPREVPNIHTGELKPSPFSSVSKREHTLFLKKLRNHFGSGIRFFMSGEYGELTYRPHYHYILLGAKIHDAVFFQQNFRGDMLYVSPTIDRLWRNSDGTSKGFHTLSHVTFDTANYVTRYVVKKRKKIDKDTYAAYGLDPEFCLMSRNPGLGKDYFDSHADDIYLTDNIVLPGHDGAFSVHAPKYYDRLLDRLDPDRLEGIKSRRRASKDQSDDTLHYLFPNVSEEDIFSSRERALENKIILKKGGVL